MKRIVVFSGAGISAESGLKTFRDSDGLWENYKISDVATPDAWIRNPKLLLTFYNERRKQVVEAKPNDAHISIAKMETKFHVDVITQNIDDLHERAGSSRVLHLHGEIRKAQSTRTNEVVHLEGWQLNLGDKCSKGFQLRPHVVWFGEAVPNMDKAIDLVKACDYFVVVGTSLNVYPAAGLVYHAPEKAIKYIVDPKEFTLSDIKNLRVFQDKATVGVKKLIEELLPH